MRCDLQPNGNELCPFALIMDKTWATSGSDIACASCRGGCGALMAIRMEDGVEMKILSSVAGRESNMMTCTCPRSRRLV